MNNNRNKVCFKCGKIFYGNTIRTKFCSEKCRDSGYSNTCHNCGVKFYSRYENTKYCSEHCRKTQFDKICAICGKKFNASTINSKYCSSKCKDIAMKKYAEEYRKKDKNLHVEFVVNEIIKRGQIARNNFGISLERKDITVNYTMMQNVKKRDKYTCRVCRNDTNLEVHHIEKVRHGGNEEYENLITLCKSCHRAIDTLNLQHAINRCTSNYNKNNIKSNKINSKQYKTILRDTLIDLNSIYKKIEKNFGDEDECDEILILIDNIINNGTNLLE